MGKEKGRYVIYFSFLFPSSSADVFFPSSQLPYATQKAPAEKTKLCLEGKFFHSPNEEDWGIQKSKKMYMINRVGIRAPYPSFTESTVSVL